MNFILYFLARIDEPSSAAGLGLIANGLNEALGQHNIQLGIVNIFSGLAAFFAPEKKKT